MRGQWDGGAASGPAACEVQSPADEGESAEVCIKKPPNGSTNLQTKDGLLKLATTTIHQQQTHLRAGRGALPIVPGCGCCLVFRVLFGGLLGDR